MIINKPPMGWNSWNTFGEKINEDSKSSGISGARMYVV